MDVQTILISFIVAITVIYTAYKFISLSKERQVENIKCIMIIEKEQVVDF